MKVRLRDITCLLQSVLIPALFSIAISSFIVAPSYSEELKPESLEPKLQKDSPSVGTSLGEMVAEIEKESTEIGQSAELFAGFDIISPQEKFSEAAKKVSSIDGEVDMLLMGKNLTSQLEMVNEAETKLRKTRAGLVLINAELADYIAKFTEELANLDSRESKWKVVLEKRELDSLLKQQIESHLKFIVKSKQTLKPSITRLLEVRKSSDQLLEDIKVKLLETDQLTQTIRANLFDREEVTLFSGEFWRGLTTLSPSELFATMINNLGKGVSFLLSNQKSLWLHLATILGMVALVFRIKNTAFCQQAFPRLYDNPYVIIFSSCLLISYLIYEDADRNFYSLVGLLLLPPLTFLFLDVLDRSWRFFILGTSGILLIDLVRNFLVAFAELNQFLLIIQLLGAAYLARKFSNLCSDEIAAASQPTEEPEELETEETSSKQPSPSPIYWSVAQFFHLASFAFLMIVACLLCGFWNLGSFLEQSIFGALYSAILLYATYQLSKGFVFAVLLAPGARELNFVKSNRPLIRGNMEFLLGAGFLFLWLKQLLVNLGGWEFASGKVAWILDMGIQAGDLFITLGGVLLSGLILWAGFKISKMLRVVLAEDLYSRNNFDAGLINTVDTSVHYTVIIAAFFAAVSALGVGFQNVALIAGALSVGIGFGLQNIVNNFVSGIILLVERPVQVGDLILIGDTLGNVERIGIRSCTVKTFDDADIIFPNATLVTERVVNWTHSSHRARISASVGVAYGSDVELCMKTLAEAAKALPFVLAHPEVVVLFEEFADSSLNFTVRAWVLNVNKRPEYKSDLLLAISKALDENDIVVPFPQRDVHLINSSG